MRLGDALFMRKPWGPTVGLDRIAAAAVGVGMLLSSFMGASAQELPPGPAGARQPLRGGPAAVGPGTKSSVQVNKPAAFQGYTLLFPLLSTKTYLLDMQGKVVRTWQSRYTAGQDAYLLPNGHLLRSAKLADGEAFFAGPAQGGRVQEFTWDGQLVWDFKFHNEKQLQHHAITPMPNGNVLLTVWERKTAKEASEAGVKVGSAGDSEMLVDSIIEVKPKGKTGGEVVWEWHLWDHLVQDHDRSKANFGDVASHPELVDANFARDAFSGFANLARFIGPPAGPDEPKKPQGKNDALDRLKGIGYVGASGGRKFAGLIPDWTHVNGVSYNPKLDQIMLSPREFSEVWIIDHSTTKAEAAGHAGGRCGRGGDLLYRWGNPRAYRAGTPADQRLFTQHDTQWIPEGCPGEGHLLVFNNGGGRPDGNYSSVAEVVLPVRADGTYERQPGLPFGPDQPLWSYTAANKSDFFAPLMSGAQRLPNGNTLICTGFSGTIFEVTPQKETAWEYINPHRASVSMPGFGPPPGGPPGFRGPNPIARSGQTVEILPVFLQFFLRLSDDQRKRVTDFEKEASRQLEGMLTDEQRKQVKDSQKNAPPFGPAGPGGPGLPGAPPEIGLVVSTPLQAKLKLSADQKTKLADLQKQADRAVDEILNEEQKKQFKSMKDMMKMFAGGPPGGLGPPGRGPGPGGGFGPPGPGGFPGMGGGGPLFRAYRYGTTYPGFAGKTLTPTKTIEDRESKPVPKTSRTVSTQGE